MMFFLFIWVFIISRDRSLKIAYFHMFQVFFVKSTRELQQVLCIHEINNFQIVAKQTTTKKPSNYSGFL